MNRILLNANKNFPNNYYYLKSIFNIGRSIERETNQNNKKIIHKNIAIEQFKKKYDTNFKRLKKPSTKGIDDEYPINDLTNVKDLCIYEPKGSKEDNILRDLYFLIPQENKIEKLVLFHANLTNVSILSDFPLYNLKYLDLSLNSITNVKFLERINFNKLKFLYLNHNKISDISPLIHYYIVK